MTESGTILLEIKEKFDEERLRVEVTDRGKPEPGGKTKRVFESLVSNPNSSDVNQREIEASLYSIRMLTELQVGKLWM